jgi:acetyl esterase/lipase
VVRLKAIALPLLLGLAACAMRSDAQSPAPAPGRLLTWSDLLGRARPAPTATIPYGTDPLQVVDLWLPAGSGPHPTVLMVHGGCWQTAVAERTIMNWIADDLRRRGIAVWNIEYRGVDRLSFPYQGIFEDVSAAADALQTHAPQHNLDIGRLVAVGHSAGGHLALWLTARPRIRTSLFPVPETALRIHHAVSLGGLPDLEQALEETQGCGQEPVRRLLMLPNAEGDETFPATHTDGSAYWGWRTVPRLGPLGVPQTLINGDSDRIIPTHFANDYARNMRNRGDRVTVRIIPRQGHVELVAPESAAWAAAVEEIEHALAR